MSEAYSLNLEALRQCKSAAESLQTIVTKNQEIQARNANITASANQAWRDWNKRKDARNREQNNWDVRKQEWINLFNSDQGIQKMGCGAAGTNRGCDGGWDFIRNDGCGWWNAGLETSCRRSSDTANREAIAKTYGERGGRPADFNEVEPVDGQGSYQHEALLPATISVSCCSNFQNIVGSEVSSSNLSQVNECITNLDNTIKSKEGSQAAGVTNDAYQKLNNANDTNVLKNASGTYMGTDLSLTDRVKLYLQNNKVLTFGSIFLSLLFSFVVISSITLSGGGGILLIATSK